MEFQKLVETFLSEDVMSGGAESAFGPGVQATASEFSKDSYATGDARTPKSLYGGVMTRMGMKRKSKSKAPKRRTKRKKK